MRNDYNLSSQRFMMELDYIYIYRTVWVFIELRGLFSIQIYLTTFSILLSTSPLRAKLTSQHDIKNVITCIFQRVLSIYLQIYNDSVYD